MDQSSDVLASRVDGFCEKLDASPLGGDNKIAGRTAVYHKISDIKRVILEVLGSTTKLRIEGRVLHQEMWLGKHLLESGSETKVVYAFTKEGVRRIFEAIEKKEKQQEIRRPKEPKVCLSSPATSTRLSSPAGWGQLQYGKRPDRWNRIS